MQSFCVEEIFSFINRLKNKSGTFYNDRGIWNSLCRVERGKVSNKMRFSIYERDGYRCRRCGVSERYATLEIDHIIPISKGGKSTYENLQTLCRKCNYEKGNKRYYWYLEIVSSCHSDFCIENGKKPWKTEWIKTQPRRCDQCHWVKELRSPPCHPQASMPILRFFVSFKNDKNGNMPLRIRGGAHRIFLTSWHERYGGAALCLADFGRAAGNQRCERGPRCLDKRSVSEGSWICWRSLFIRSSRLALISAQRFSSAMVSSSKCPSFL